MAFTIKMDNLIAMQTRFEMARPGLTRVIKLGVQAAGDAAVSDLHDQAPYDAAPNNGVIPGEEEHLNDSFSTAPSDSLGGILNVITSEPIKFQYVTQGTASMIYPVVKKALWWPDAMHPYSSVHGQAANPFQIPIGADLLTRGEEFFGPPLQRWLARLEP